MSSCKTAWRVGVYHFDVSISWNADIFEHFPIQMLDFQYGFFKIEI